MNWPQIAKLMAEIRGKSLQYLKVAAERHEINFHQLLVMRVLSKNSSMNQQEIADFLGMDKSLITRAIQKSVDEGYIDRQPDPNDRRSYNIFLTKLGRDKIEVMSIILDDWNHLIFQDFSYDDFRRLISYLEKILENIGDDENE